MITKRYVGSDPEKLRSQIEADCGPHIPTVVSFQYAKPRGIRRLFFGPRVEVVVRYEEPNRVQEASSLAD